MCSKSTIKTPERRQVSLSTVLLLTLDIQYTSDNSNLQGIKKIVRVIECSSYRGFELSSDFYEKVLVKVQREFKNSSSYWKFELSGTVVI